MRRSLPHLTPSRVATGSPRLALGRVPAAFRPCPGRELARCRWSPAEGTGRSSPSRSRLTHRRPPGGARARRLSASWRAPVALADVHAGLWGGHGERFLPALLRGAQGEVRTRVPRVRIPAGRWERGGGAGGGGPGSRRVGYRARVAPASFNARPLPTGKLRYANNSNYKNDVMIRKEVRAAPAARLRAFVPAKGTLGRAASESDSGQGSGLGFVAGVFWAGLYLFLCRNVVSRLTCTRVWWRNWRE